MKRLLIDLGNTQLKWAVLDGSKLGPVEALAHDQINRFSDFLVATNGISHALGVAVAKPDLRRQLDDLLRGKNIANEWLQVSSESLGVRNNYAIEQLGSDRWAAVLGARQRQPERSVLVVMAGTATTIDVLRVNGIFEGGMILPGLQLMRRSFEGNAANLYYADGLLTEFPRNTADALYVGCVTAQAASIEFMYRKMADTSALCLIGGGAAEAISACLSIPFQSVPELVFEGLRALLLENTE